MTYIKKYTFLVIISFIFTLVGVISSLFIPIFIGRAVDYIVSYNNVDFTAVLKYVIYILIAIVISGFFTWATSAVNNVLSYKTVKDLRTQAFNHLQLVPIKYIDKTAHGDIVSRLINDIDQIQDGIIQGFSQFFTSIITIVMTLIFMFLMNFWITIIVVVLTPLSFFVANFIAKRTNKMYKKSSQIQGELSGFVNETIQNIKVVNTFSLKELKAKEFEAINSELMLYGQKAQFYSSLANPCTRFVNGVVFACVAIFGAISAVGGGLTIGQITSFLSYANQYTKPFNEITSVTAQLQAAIVSANRVFALLDEPIEDDLGTIGNESLNENSESNFSFKDVSFSYNKDVELLKNLNLIVKTGQKVAIVGPTGCGKTTLINLLLRFYDCDSGVISFNDYNINDLRRKTLRENFGMVLQDTWVFKGTIAQNIAYTKEDATMEEIIKAATNAYAHRFISLLPNGYDTVISDGGDNLSEGQKQLLCIARIMLKNPKVLILDEATSNIDIKTEAQIIKAFEKLCVNKTSFVVAHRLSTIRNSDLILVMNKGNIVEVGNYKELLDKKGFFYNLQKSN